MTPLQHFKEIVKTQPIGRYPKLCAHYKLPLLKSIITQNGCPIKYYRYIKSARCCTKENIIRWSMSKSSSWFQSRPLYCLGIKMPRNYNMHEQYWILLHEFIHWMMDHCEHYTSTIKSELDVTATLMTIFNELDFLSDRDAALAHCATVIQNYNQRQRFSTREMINHVTKRSPEIIRVAKLLKGMLS